MHMCSSVYREGFRQSLYTDFGVPLQLIFSPGISCLIFQQLAWNSVLLTPQTSKIDQIKSIHCLMFKFFNFSSLKETDFLNHKQVTVTLFIEL